MTTTPLPSFRELLRAYRLRARLTQEELAKRADLSLNAVSALERGVNQQPRKETVRLLAEALGLDPAERTAFTAAARAEVEVAAPATAPLAALAPAAAIREPVAAPTAAAEPATEDAPADYMAATLPLDPWPATDSDDRPTQPALVEPPPGMPLPAGARRRPLGLAAGLIALAALLLGSMTVWGQVAGSPAPTPTPVPVAESQDWYVAGGVQVEPLDLAADGVWAAPLGRIVTATFRVRNAGHQPATLRGFGAGMRRPTNCAKVWDGPAYDFPAVERTITLQPGEEFLYQRAQMLTEPGVYFVEPLKLDNHYKWGGLGPFPRIWFRVINPRVPPAADRGCLPTPPAATPTR
ncbi:MAG: helix-turn-helix domain-containing protein [Chloroflexota bacterium]|nr:helix-turn-helix domain-containing protein [Chloroflexota bacterium]